MTPRHAEIRSRSVFSVLQWSRLNSNKFLLAQSFEFVVFELGISLWMAKEKWSFFGVGIVRGLKATRNITGTKVTLVVICDRISSALWMRTVFHGEGMFACPRHFEVKRL